MNLMLLKYYLTFVFKKREREREREREDGMPKKHDPKKRREKMACQRSMAPANKIKHEKEHVFICALT